MKPIDQPAPTPQNPPDPAMGPILNAVPPSEGFIRTWIVGNPYHPAVLHPGDPVQIEREADNLHDANAILIRDGKGLSAGYLPHYDADYLAPLFDQGVIQIEARLLFPPADDAGRIPVLLRVRFTAVGLSLVKADSTTTPAALMHNLFAAAWRDLSRFNPGPLRQLREQLRPLAHNCALKPITKLLYRLLKEPLASAANLEPLPNPFCVVN